MGHRNAIWDADHKMAISSCGRSLGTVVAGSPCTKKARSWGGTGQGEAPRAVQTWRLPSSKAATFGDDYLIKAPVPYFVKFLPKFFDKKYILAIFTPQKHIPASSKETGIVPHTPCMCGFFLAQPRQEDMKRILRQAYKHFFVKPGGKFFQKKQWPGPR